MFVTELRLVTEARKITKLENVTRMDARLVICMTRDINVDVNPDGSCTLPLFVWRIVLLVSGMML